MYAAIAWDSRSRCAWATAEAGVSTSVALQRDHERPGTGAIGRGGAAPRREGSGPGADTHGRSLGDPPGAAPTTGQIALGAQEPGGLEFEVPGIAPPPGHRYVV